MQGILMVLALAVTVEAVVEYAKAVVHAAAQKDVKGLITRTAALAISLLLCFAAGADLYAVLGLDFRLPGIGTALTGIFASRGANYMNDLIQKLRQAGEAE